MLVHQCARIVDRAVHVEVHDDGLARLAARADPALLHVPSWAGPAMYQGPPARVVAWLVAYNAINYCYWPEPGQPRWAVQVGDSVQGADDEALGVMAAFGEALDRGIPLDDGAWLAQVDEALLAELLAPAPGFGPLPMLAERAAALRELGACYLALGGAMGLVASGQESAPGLAQALARHCPSWEDGRVLHGERLRFLKRAQLCVAMIYGRFAGQGPGAFSDVDRLSAFADYRLPQVLRATGALRLSPELEAHVAAQRPLAADSPEEVEIRAATVHLAERLRVRLSARWPELTALQVDHLLWRSAVEMQDELPPFHRTRTTAY